MEKALVVLSWVVAIIGVGSVCLTTYFIDNFILFYAGWALLVIGIISILFTNGRSRKYILDLLNFI